MRERERAKFAQDETIIVGVNVATTIKSHIVMNVIAMAVMCPLTLQLAKFKLLLAAIAVIVAIAMYC